VFVPRCFDEKLKKTMRILTITIRALFAGYIKTVALSLCVNEPGNPLVLMSYVCEREASVVFTPEEATGFNSLDRKPMGHSQKLTLD
jgi:hypothetical protein